MPTVRLGPLCGSKCRFCARCGSATRFEAQDCQQRMGPKSGPSRAKRSKRMEQTRQGRTSNMLKARPWLMLALVAALGARLSADQPVLEAVLERTGQYVAEFAEHFSNVVAEERY